MNNDAVKANLELLNNKPARQPNLHEFADGVFKVPTKYTCVHCGKVNAVTPAVLIKRVEKNYNGSLRNYLEHAECSECKKLRKLKAEQERINKLLAERATTEIVTK